MPAQEALMRARSTTISRSWLIGQFAHRNRAQLTDSEARLWAALSGGKLGVRFRRQVPLAGIFIVDFFAPSVRLIVEVDGGYHAQRRRADERRDAKLQRLNYRVLRLDASLLMRDLPAALSLIRDAL
jgi:very-short-patch-repair endonuclease